MIMLQAAHVSKAFGQNIILNDVNINIQEKERVGLVGPNGAGKSTLLKILTGSMNCDSGNIIKPREVSLGYLAQDGGLVSERTVWDEMISVFQELIAKELVLRELEKQMGNARLSADIREQQKFMEEYAGLAEELEQKNYYGYEAAVRSILHGLKFMVDDYHTLVRSLSGGQKTRLALGKLLLSQPDVLVLDEPTNYLDMETMSWLEQYLQEYTGAVLVVSHDRYFLDSLVRVVYELVNGRAVRYAGNYSQFVEIKAGQVEQQLKEYKKQSEEITRTEDFIRRNIVRASTTKRAQSCRKRLESMEKAEKPMMQKNVSFSFGLSVESSYEVLRVKNLDIGYKDNPLASGINFEIEKGERVALVGPNGVGKTTLLKTLSGTIKALDGAIFTGINVKLNCYEQEQAKIISTKQVLHELWDEYPHLDEKYVRTLLGNFLFRGDDVFKNASDLSGGERSRLSLAKLVLKKANFLLLDEPTNHLDVYSKEVLEDSLADYQGTLLFVSHDRYFLNKIATRVLELTQFGIIDYTGNYDYYLKNRKSRSINIVELVNREEEIKKEAARHNYQFQKEAQRQKEKLNRRKYELEELIRETESEIALLEKEIYLPEVNQNISLLLEKNSNLESKKLSLEVYLDEWIELADQ
jgi:ATP-binding cassette subfamily F protein 3